MEEKIRKNLPLLIFLFFMLTSVLRTSFLYIFLFLFILAVIILYFSQKLIPDFRFLNKINKKNQSKVIDIDNLNLAKNMKKNVFLTIIIIFAVWLFFASIVIIDAGETGVYSLFGKVRDKELHSGFHLVNPLARVTRMSIRTEEYTMSIQKGEGRRYNADAINALTKEGLSIDLDITTLYHLDEDKVSDLYKNIAKNMNDLAEKIIRPTIRTAIRDIIAQYEAKDIYSEKREEAANKIAEKLNAELLSRGVVVESVLLRNVVLPANLSKSIQEKLQAEQEAQKYDFILERERKEKERKIIAAEGQRDSQKIINESLSNNYLYYLYISELKDRQGTIYVPTNPSTGMPLFRDIGK